METQKTPNSRKKKIWREKSKRGGIILPDLKATLPSYSSHSRTVPAQMQTRRPAEQSTQKWACAYTDEYVTAKAVMCTGEEDSPNKGYQEKRTAVCQRIKLDHSHHMQK